MKQGSMSSPLLFNVYMDNFGIQLRRQFIGCNVSYTVVNHMFCASINIDTSIEMTLAKRMTHNGGRPRQVGPSTATHTHS